MKVQPFFDKLANAPQYKDFVKKNKDAYMVAGFFVLDFEGGKNLNQIDFYVPSKKKIAAFTIERKVTMQLLDVVNNKEPEALDAKAKVDLDALYGILEDEMKNRGVTEDIRKIIAVLQNLGGKKIWSLNCVLSGMSILNAHVEDDSESVLKMERKSLADYIRRMPMQQAPTAAPAQTEVGSGDDVKDKLKKLEELQAAIEQEKAELSKAPAKAKNGKEKEAAAEKAPAKSADTEKQLTRVSKSKK